ncbi:MAG: leucine dehydrogenase [Deltaproteobacteria bacterium]|nr:leucine dehydrogenase [Deltaproteobacteria bacterium]
MLEKIFEDSFEQVSFFSDPKANLKCIIAIHSTKRGPALGGCRYKFYDSTNDALWDVLRLSKGMTLKASAAELPLGGGKSVIIKDLTKPTDRGDLFRSFGKCVESLGGKYITAEDVGTTAEDMDVIAEVTSHVRGCAKVNGDPSPYTAKGVFLAIEKSFEYLHSSLNQKYPKTVLVQGVGAVGLKLILMLVDAGYEVSISDINQDRIREALQQIPNLTVVEPNQALSAPVTCFSPCALGAVINPESISQLQCKLIVGAANNQLSGPECYEPLRSKKILYAPDFIVNVGGLIKVASEGIQNAETWIDEKINKIPNRLISIFEEYERSSSSTEELAIQLAMRNLQ